MSEDFRFVEGQGPPPAAYSRVTNPGRFAPLHDGALALLARLTAEFEVERRRGMRSIRS